MLSNCLPSVMDMARGKVASGRTFAGMVPEEGGPAYGQDGHEVHPGEKLAFGTFAEEAGREVRGAPTLPIKSVLKPAAPAPAKEEKKEENPLAAKIASIKASFKTPVFVVLVAGSVLAHCAGFVNAVASFQMGSFVSHVTGSVTGIGMRLEGYGGGRVTGGDLIHVVLLVVTFWVGAIFCGIYVAKNEIQFGKSMYGWALITNSVFVLCGIFLAPQNVALYFLAAACGCQNGMCTMHFGAIVRTTHMTGITTDLGTTVGRILAIMGPKGFSYSSLGEKEQAEIEVDFRKLKTFGILLISFLMGGIYGAYFNRWFGIHALYVPASITGLGGVAYSFFRPQLKKQFKTMQKQKLEANIAEVQTILERTKQSLAEVKAPHGIDLEASSPMSPGVTRVALDLDDQMDYVLRIMNDVEDCVEELYGHRPGAARM